MKFRVLLTICDRDTGEIFKPGSIWDDHDQRTDYERAILREMGAITPLSQPQLTQPVQPDTQAQEKTK